MRIGLAVDPNCDLPWEFIEQHRIAVLPVMVRVDQKVLEDVRKPEPTQAFYRKEYGNKTHDAETSPCSVEQVRDLFLSRLVLEFDHVFCETVMQSRSPIHAHARQASAAILNGYQEVRKQSGAATDGVFSMRVVDSKTLAAGQGALAAETIRLIGEGLEHFEIRTRIEKLAEQAYCYAVPPDLFYVRARARKKGDKSVSWLGAAVGSALNIKPIIRAHRGDTGPVAKVRGFPQAAERLFNQAARLIDQDRLLAPHVCVSYAGNLARIRELRGFKRLEQAAQKRNVSLMEAVMSPATSVNLGPGALSIGFLAQNHEFGA
jgi:DegV family protein with EDD domain